MDWITIGIILLLGYCVLVILGFTCIQHKWEKHGPTWHMANDLKTGKLEGWGRMWWVCHRCGKRKHAEKIDKDDIDE
jgi:hypothetical protein